MSDEHQHEEFEVPAELMEFMRRSAEAQERNAALHAADHPLPDYRKTSLEWAMYSLGANQGVTADIDDQRILERAEKFYGYLVGP